MIAVPPIAREFITTWWSEASTAGLWAAPWSKSLEGLSATQAAWQPPSPAGPRHSIWQVTLHMIFWRESWLRRAATAQKPSDAELAAGNYPTITDASEAAWLATKQRFERTQTAMA